MAEKHSKLLVSFCNVLPRGLGLGIFDFDEENFQWVDLSEISHDILGVNGLLYNDKKYRIVTQVGDNGASALTELDEKFKIVKNFVLKITKDAHSSVPFDNGFLVTDTGNDRVNKITFSNNDSVINESEYWSQNNSGLDTKHVNSIIKFDDEFYVSTLGSKPESGWKDAKNGQIINISSGKIIVDDLKHPHSLLVDEKNLYWLESLTGLVHRFSNKKGHEIVLQLEGYVRGFTHDEENFYIGSSSYRKRSRSTGVIYDPPSQEESNFHSWVYRINKKNFQVEKKRMSEYGSEIFDLLILKHEFNFTNQENAILKRLFKYESDYYKNKMFVKEDIVRKIMKEYVDNHEWERAKFYLENILGNRIDAEFEYLLGFTFLAGFKDFKKSIQYFELSLQHGFDEFWVKFRRAEAYLKIKEYKKAQKDLERVHLLNPKNLEVKKMLDDIVKNHP